MELRRQLGPLELAHGADDLLPVGQQAVAIECGVVVPQNGAEGVGHRRRVEQFVLDDVDSSQEVPDGGE